jgi:ribosomal protein S18 acetylase RimI-like enzyme
VITVRPLRLPDDRGAVEQIDASVPIDAAWMLHSTLNGFELVLRALGEPRVKRYAVVVDEIASAGCALVAEWDGVVSAVAAVDVHAWNRRAVLAQLYVDRAARRSGLGRALVSEVEHEARSRGATRLWVETQNVNASALAFYRRCGFALCGLDASLYEPTTLPGEIALFLAKQLT